jgi:ABC-type transporter Mla MlaB component
LNANKLVDALEKEFETAETVIVDMSELERIDETAMEKLVVFNRKIKAQGKNIDLVGYNEKIQKRFDKFFKVF